MSFKELSSKPDFTSIQPEILQFWDDNNTFKKSLDNRTDKEITFYDGPPFPTGKPHHGTVLVSFMKDMVSRYWTMRGYKVPRVWGWDCHGLPIENQAETLLGINDKNEIERNLGIGNFNDKCYEIVSNNNDAWAEYIREMARWVDYDGAYKTMNIDFMESVMWAFKECYNKGLIYKDYRVTPYCTHCETSLSISDTRESDSTRPRQDRWIMVRFKTQLVEQGLPVYLLAWTTTPWTLPSNLCLAVGKDIDYAYVNVNGNAYVACTNILGNFKNVFGEKPEIIKEVKGSDLLGITYEPIFPYFKEMKEQGAFRVVSADYVGSEEGVGIVHTAPAFGEDDYWTCKNNGIPLVNPVDAKGRFTEEVTDFYPVQGEKTVIEMNPIVIRFLYEKEIAVADGTLVHNYPHCWRCKNPLIYKAMDAYYFNIDKVKDKLIQYNEKVNWIPETVKHGRFGNWLQGARDWNISRNRYWSTPIPIWECDCCGGKEVLGSIDEIEQKSGIRLTNLHRQYMDEVTYKCPKCGGTMHRVPEVLDCWFESGSVPFASKHYPFENKEWFESHFPSDFVVEYTGQIRCWFYYLHVLGTALFDRPAFKNAVVHGTILAKDGKKLSKSSKNYTDPMELMKKYGTDAFRLYLFQSNAMLLGDLLFDENGILDAYQQIILPYWNACNFFISYANIDGFQPSGKLPESDNQLDKWILAKLYETQKAVTENMDGYQVNHYVDQLVSLVEGLTNWYIRRSRRRFWASGMTEDKKNAYETLYYVLLNTTKLFAPVAPIMSEKIFKTLTDEESVHLADWPEVPASYADAKLVEQVDLVQNVIGLARSVRAKNRVKNRQPLRSLKIALSNADQAEEIKEFTDIIAEELNVKEVSILNDVSEIATVKIDPNFNAIRSLYPDKIPVIIKAVKSKAFEVKDDSVVLKVNGEDMKVSSEILLINYVAKEGMFVASQGGIVVSLDLTITEELRMEGLAREIVRNIQDTRKNIGCEITDRIVIAPSEGYPEEWAAYIEGETLSERGTVDEAEASVEIELDNGSVLKIDVKKK